MTRVNEIKKIFSKFQVGSDYSVSFEGDKKVYIVSSESLKKSLREIIFDSSLFKNAFGGMKIEGRNFQSNYFFYQEGVNSPDKFMVVSDWEERLEEIVEYSEQKERETNERMKNEKRQINRSVEENNSPFDSWNKDAVRFRRWDTEGNLVEERVKLLDKSVFFPEDLDKGNFSKIVEIDDKGNVISQEQEDNSEGKKHSSSRFSAVSDEQREKDGKKSSKENIPSETRLGKDNSQRKNLSQKELDNEYKKVDDEKDLDREQLKFIRENEKDIKRDKGISSGVAIAVACGLAFVFTFGGIIWYKKKFSRR